MAQPNTPSNSDIGNSIKEWLLNNAISKVQNPNAPESVFQQDLAADAANEEKIEQMEAKIAKSPSTLSIVNKVMGEQAHEAEEAVSNAESAITEMDNVADISTSDRIIGILSSGGLSNFFAAAGVAESLVKILEGSALQKEEAKILSVVQQIQQVVVQEEQQIKAIQQSITQLDAELGQSVATLLSQPYAEEIESAWQSWINAGATGSKPTQASLAQANANIVRVAGQLNDANNGIQTHVRSFFNGVTGQNLLDESKLGLLQQYTMLAWNKLALNGNFKGWASALLNFYRLVFQIYGKGTTLVRYSVALTEGIESAKAYATQYQQWDQQFETVFRSLIPPGMGLYMNMADRSFPVPDKFQLTGNGMVFSSIYPGNATVGNPPTTLASSYPSPNPVPCWFEEYPGSADPRIIVLCCDYENQTRYFSISNVDAGDGCGPIGLTTDCNATWQWSSNNIQLIPQPWNNWSAIDNFPVVLKSVQGTYQMPYVVLANNSVGRNGDQVTQSATTGTVELAALTD